MRENRTYGLTRGLLNSIFAVQYPTLLDEEQGKDNDFTGQFETTFKYLKNHIATASMVAEATGIPQKNICRYKRELEKAGRLKQVNKNYCEKTGFKAWYLTTNPDLFPDDNQLFLFQE